MIEQPPFERPQFSIVVLTVKEPYPACPFSGTDDTALPSTLAPDSVA